MFFILFLSVDVMSIKSVDSCVPVSEVHRVTKGANLLVAFPPSKMHLLHCSFISVYVCMRIIFVCVCMFESKWVSECVCVCVCPKK